MSGGDTRARRVAPWMTAGVLMLLSPGAQAEERRLVVYTDAPAPRLEATDDGPVHGQLELEVRFENTNPLCYLYSTNVAASQVATHSRPSARRIPGIGALGGRSSAGFATLDQALTAVSNSETELDDVTNAARIRMSLDDVWAACRSGGNPPEQRARLGAAERVATQQLGPGGPWRQVLENAETVALGAKRLSRELAAGQHDAAEDVDARKAALTLAEQKAHAQEGVVARLGRTERATAQLNTLTRDLANSRRKLREAELNVERHGRGEELGRRAERLALDVQKTRDVLDANLADVERASALLSQSPSATLRTFQAGERVALTVTRTPLERGRPIPGHGAEVFQGPVYETLRPVVFDLGIGPALGIGHDTANYATVWAPAGVQDPYPAWRVVRTEQGLPLDAMVSLSAYVWGRRYFDNAVFAPIQLAPRPMIGVSLAHPLRALYIGAEIDPLQFLDVSFGVRFANEPELVGPQVLDRALIDSDGEPEPPLTRNQIRTSGFVAVTVSANLVYTWLKDAL